MRTIYRAVIKGAILTLVYNKGNRGNPNLNQGKTAVLTTLTHFIDKNVSLIKLFH